MEDFSKWAAIDADDYVMWKAWQCKKCGTVTRLDEYVKKMPYQYCPYCGRPMENGGENNE